LRRNPAQHYQPGFKLVESERQDIANPDIKPLGKRIGRLRKALDKLYKQLTKTPAGCATAPRRSPFAWSPCNSPNGAPPRCSFCRSKLTALGAQTPLGKRLVKVIRHEFYEILQSAQFALALGFGEYLKPNRGFVIAGDNHLLTGQRPLTRLLPLKVLLVPLPGLLVPPARLLVPLTRLLLPLSRLRLPIMSELVQNPVEAIFGLTTISIRLPGEVQYELTQRVITAQQCRKLAFDDLF